MRFSHDQLLAASFRFAERGLKGLGPMERQTIVAANMCNVPLSELANRLRDSIVTLPEDDPIYRSMAYLALGRKQDFRLRSFFIARLPLELEQSLPCAWQIVIALEYLGEEILGPETKKIPDDQLMTTDVRRYLKEIATPEVSPA